MITKRDFILRVSCFYEKYSNTIIIIYITHLHARVESFTRARGIIYTRAWNHLHARVESFTRARGIIYTRAWNHLHARVESFTRARGIIYTRA